MSRHQGFEHYQNRAGMDNVRGGGPVLQRPAPNAGVMGQSHFNRALPDALGGLLEAVGSMAAEESRARIESDRTLKVMDAMGSFRRGVQEKTTAWMAENKGMKAEHAEASFARIAEEELARVQQEHPHVQDDADIRRAFARESAGYGLRLREMGIEYAGKERERHANGLLQGDFAEYLLHVQNNPFDTQYADFEKNRLLAEWQGLNPGMDSREFSLKLNAESTRARYAALLEMNPKALLDALDGHEAGAKDVSLPENIRALAEAEAQAQGVPVGLVLSVIAAESGGKADAVSSAGAEGAMQLMEGTARDMGVTDRKDPAQNIRGGVGYLKQQLDRFGDPALAAMAYNWGPGNVESYIKHGHGLKTAKNPTGAVPKETRDYVAKVTGGREGLEASALPAHERMRFRDAATGKLREEARGMLSEATTEENMALVTGDASRLFQLADALAGLGQQEAAEKTRKKAEQIDANAELVREIDREPLPRAMEILQGLDADIEFTAKNGQSAGFAAATSKREVAAKAIERKLKLFKEDPAGAVAERVFAKEPQEMATERLRLQEENGLPPMSRRILTKAEASQYGTAWRDGDLGTRQSLAHTLLQYGEHAGTVAREVGLSPAEQLAMRHSLRNGIYNLGAAIAAHTGKKDDLPKVVDVDKNRQTLIDESEVCKAYRALCLALPGSSDLLSQYASIQDSAERYFRATGGDKAKALALMDGKMEAVTSGNYALLVDTSLFTTRQVEGALSSATGTQLEEFARGMNDAKGKPLDEQAQKDYARQMRRGVWVNAPDGNGYVLVDQVSQLPTRNREGRWFRVTEKDIAGYRVEEADDPWTKAHS